MGDDDTLDAGASTPTTRGEQGGDAPTTPDYNDLLDADQARILAQRDELEARDSHGGHGRSADRPPGSSGRVADADAEEARAME